MHDAVLRMAAIAGLSLVGIEPLAAQTLSGRVIDSETREPVSAAAVHLLKAGTELFSTGSDSAGTFRIALPGAGTYVLRMVRLGYEPVLTPPIDVAAGELVEIEVRIAVAAMPLHPLTVSARRMEHGVHPDYYRRLAWGRNSGQGDFITRAELDDGTSTYLSSYVGRLPYASLRDVGGKLRPVLDGSCLPDVYVNGAPVDVTGQRSLPIHLQPSLDDLFNPGYLEGLEIYRLREIPMEYARRDVCGVIVAWVRQPDTTGRQSLLRLMIGGGLMLGLVLAAVF